MREFAGNLRFVPEFGGHMPDSIIVERLEPCELDRNFTVERRVERAVDDPRSPLAGFRHDFVTADPVAVA